MIGGDFIDASAKGRQSRSGRAGETALTGYLDTLWDQASNPGPAPSQAAIMAQMRAWKPAAIVADAVPTSQVGMFLIKEFGQPTVIVHRFMAWKFAENRW